LELIISSLLLFIKQHFLCDLTKGAESEFCFPNESKGDEEQGEKTLSVKNRRERSEDETGSSWREEFRSGCGEE
jgi:hypothetical protein